MHLKQAVPLSLVDQAIDGMKDLIASGEWAVGTRVPPEPVLAELLGVSRNTVREAVGALAHLGMLNVRRGAGTTVVAASELLAMLRRQTQRRDVGHLVEVGQALEARAAQLAAERRTVADLRVLDGAMVRRDDAAFHRVLVEAAHNPFLAELHEALVGALGTACAALDSPDLADAHRNLVAAVRARDPAAAAGAAAAVHGCAG